MESPKISFRNLDPSPFAEEQVRHRIAELAQVHERITACRVVMESAPRNLFQVNMDIVVPGGEIVVREAHDDLYAAIRAAFDTARRRLSDHRHRLAGR